MSDDEHENEIRPSLDSESQRARIIELKELCGDVSDATYEQRARCTDLNCSRLLPLRACDMTCGTAWIVECAVLTWCVVGLRDVMMI